MPGGTLSVPSRGPSSSDLVADPETLMRHGRIQAQRPTAMAVEPVPYQPKQPKRRVDWAAFIRSAEIN